MIGDFVLGTATAIVGLPLIVFSAELACGLLPARKLRPHAGDLSIAVLMPAHDEGKVIAHYVGTARAAMRETDLLLVVADNCTDDTAAAARQAGARVVERHDPLKRGKGFALAHGIAELAADPPDCLVILDADCDPAPGAVERLARLALAQGRAVQACYVFRPSSEAGPVTRVSNFAFMLKNRLRQRGMMRLGGTCVLTGSGMAFPWAQIAAADLANGEIVEDLVLGLRLTLQGEAPLYDDAAQVFSEPAPSDTETVKQRRRWEHGFVSTAIRFVPRLLAPSRRPGIRARLWTAAHLLVPPFMLLLALALLLGGVAAIGGAFGLFSAGPVLVPAGMAAILIGLIGLAWLVAGRSYLGLRDVLALPGYLAAKLGIWRGFVSARETTWAKTRR